MPIEPDTKNWTWVLERPCPECGFDASTVGRDDVAPVIRANARAWERVLAAAGVGVRPNDEMWSPLEYGCHVRDVYRIMTTRVDLVLTESDPMFPNWDQDATAVDDAYDTQDPARRRGRTRGRRLRSSRRGSAPSTASSGRGRAGGVTVRTSLWSRWPGTPCTTWSTT